MILESKLIDSGNSIQEFEIEFKIWGKYNQKYLWKFERPANKSSLKIRIKLFLKFYSSSSNF